MAFNYPPGTSFGNSVAEFEFHCDCGNSWVCPGYVERDTGAGVLFNEDGKSDDPTPGPTCGRCGEEGYQ